MTEAFNAICSVHKYRIMRVGGCPAVMAQWQSTGGSRLKLEVSWVQLPATAGPFTFRLIASKFLYNAGVDCSFIQMNGIVAY